MVHLLGIRHLSPACARLVAATMERLRPAHVLIEGPADLTDHVDQLLAPHTLPIGWFSWRRTPDAVISGTWPVDTSAPEWVAARMGRASGAEVRFCDLPHWLPRADDQEPASLPFDLSTLLEDAIEHLDDPDTLGPKLAELFDAWPVGPSAHSSAREAFMAQTIAATAATARGPVLVVLGGAHVRRVRELWPTMPPHLPRVETPDDPHGAWLVPCRTAHLRVGMPHLGWQRRVMEVGPSHVADRMLRDLSAALAAAGHPASPADLIATRTTALALAAQRSHPAPGRRDLLDAIRLHLLQAALPAPPPWDTPRPPHPDDPLPLATIEAVFTDDRFGALAPGTPLPPLVADVLASRVAFGLQGPQTRHLLPHRAEDRPLSVFLHRLAALGAPSVTVRVERAVERWTLQDPILDHVLLLEAGRWGGDLLSATAACLRERVRHAADASTLVEALVGAVRAEIPDLHDDLALGDAIERTTALADLDQPLALLCTVPPTAATALAAHLRAAVSCVIDRALWLLDVRVGPAEPAHEGELRLLRLLLLLTDEHPSLPGRLLTLARRRLRDPDLPPHLRGAFHGVIGRLHQAPTTDPLRDLNPAHLGDLLSGLVALTRDHLPDALLDALDARISALSSEDFFEALPALRRAWAWLPPAERARVAARLTPHPTPPDAPHDPDAAAREAQAAATARRWGLADAADGLPA